MFELKEFQIKAKNKLRKYIINNKEEIIMQAPTGAGKTVILDKTIEEIFHITKNNVFIWFTPGNGELEEQSRKSFEKYINGFKTKNLDEAIRQGINENEVVFINWEQVNKKDNKALREQEKKNLKDRIKEYKDKGKNFILIIDESHRNFTAKTKEIINLFENSQKIYVSATIDKNKMPIIDVEITEEEVIKSGLITKLININENISKKTKIITNEEELLIDLAINKQKEIKKEYSKLEININPLIIIQYPNENTDNKIAKSSAELLNRVNKYLNKKGYSYENKTIACWLDGNKQNINEDNQPLNDVIILHTKQALATGWDCPRAKILVKLRDNMNETFEIQVLGRIRRMPEQKHYENSILDNCYLYTFDEKYKEAAISTYGGKETKILYLKEEYNNKNLQIGLKRQVKSIENTMIDEKEQSHILYKYIKEKYKLEEVLKSSKDKSGYNRNKTKLEKLTEDKDGYIFKNEVEQKVIETSTTLTDISKQVANTTIKENFSNNDLYEKQRDATWIISTAVGVSDKIIRTSLQKLFLIEKINPKRKRNYSGGVLNLNKRDFWTFIINNKEQIIKDFKEARYDFNNQKSFKIETIKEFDFEIPEKDIVYLDKTIKNVKELQSNVYEDYTTDIDHSLPERRFEKYCENNSKIEWFYKNGDKGQNYFSIIYIDSLGRQNLFYPDYILKASNKLYIIETKGGLWKDGSSKNIDKDKASLKLECLKKYVEKHNNNNSTNQIDFAFVKDEDIEDDVGNSSYKLFYTKEKWTEDLDNNIWYPLDKLFN